MNKCYKNVLLEFQFIERFSISTEIYFMHWEHFSKKGVLKRGTWMIPTNAKKVICVSKSTKYETINYNKKKK